MFSNRLFLLTMTLLQKNVPIVSTFTYICIITPHILLFIYAAMAVLLQRTSYL